MNARSTLPLCSLLCAAFAFASPARANGLASYSDEDVHRPADRTGLFAGLGGGVGLQIFGENDFAYDVEGRLGYSFGPPLAVYLSGALDGSSTSAGGTFRSVQLTVNLQYHLYTSPKVGLYARGGIGLALAGPIGDKNAGLDGVGLAFSGGLGVEFRVAPDLFLAPEFFYRRATVTASNIDGREVDAIGLSLSLFYY